MIILIDCDGILSDFNGHLSAVLKEQEGFDLDVEKVEDFEYSTILRWRDELWNYCKEPGFVAEMPVLPGAVNGVRALRDNGEVVCVTAPFLDAPHWMHERQEWLTRHFGFSHKDVIFTHRKGLVTGDVLIDDSIEHTRSFRNAPSLLWTRPWNKKESHYHRVSSWAQVLHGIP